MILCFQLCGNSLGKALSCFSMTMPPCTRRGPYRNDLLRSVWKNSTGLHRALTSTPSNTFGMNWNTDCEPHLMAQYQCPTSLMHLWLNGSKSPQQCSSGKPSQKSGGCCSCKGGPTPKMMQKEYPCFCHFYIRLLQCSTFWLPG